MRKFDQDNGSSQYRRPSLWLAIPVVLVLTLVWTNTDYPVDYWLHINNGAWMVEHGALITHDTFSHTIEGQAVKNQPWLAQLVMSSLHDVGGYAMNQFVAGLCYVFGVIVVMWLVVRRSGNWTLAAAAGCLATALMATNMAVRPQCFSVVLFAGELWLLTRVRSTLILAIACFLTTALWTNLHGAFPLGAVLPGIFLASSFVDWFLKRAQSSSPSFQRVKGFGCATLASVLGCFIRPQPGDAIGYVTNCSARSVERELVEWLPTSLATEAGAMFFVSLALAMVICGLSRRRLDWTEIMLLGAFFFLASSSQRMVLWWAFVLPFALTRPADQLWRAAVRWRNQRQGLAARDSQPQTSSRLDRLMGYVMGAFVVLFLLFSTPWSRSANACLPKDKRVTEPNGQPNQLVERMLSCLSPSGSKSLRTFAPLPWGSYLTWRSGGRLKSFIDTRVDFFPDPVWNAYNEIAYGEPEALDLLDHYHVDLVSCDIRQDPLISQLMESESWSEIHRDGVGVLFQRASGE